MKVTTGVDIVKVSRIEEILEKQDGFMNRVFTQNEIEYCINAKAHKYESFAARFAAKEAVFKALNVNSSDNTVEWKDIEVINKETGRPKIVLKGKFAKYIENICNIDVSLSHEKQMAVASVAILWK